MKTFSRECTACKQLWTMFKAMQVDYLLKDLFRILSRSCMSVENNSKSSEGIKIGEMSEVW